MASTSERLSSLLELRSLFSCISGFVSRGNFDKWDLIPSNVCWQSCVHSNFQLCFNT